MPAPVKCELRDKKNICSCVRSGELRLGDCHCRGNFVTEVTEKKRPQRCLLGKSFKLNIQITNESDYLFRKDF